MAQEKVKDEEKVKGKEKEIDNTHEKEHKQHKHNKELETALNDLALEKEKSMRIQAEMMNFRRRKEDEVANIRKYANEDILRDLVGIMDNFERALSMENEDNKEFLKGFQMIYTNIQNIITSSGVTEIDALEHEFDPTYHQAVLTETRDGIESGIVIEVLQKGYMYKDKVLRPSMVKVSE
jgi:molecular chaperone GrpE